MKKNLYIFVRLDFLLVCCALFFYKLMDKVCVILCHPCSFRKKIKLKVSKPLLAPIP